MYWYFLTMEQYKRADSHLDTQATAEAEVSR